MLSYLEPFIIWYGILSHIMYHMENMLVFTISVWWGVKIPYIGYVWNIEFFIIILCLECNIYVIIFNMVLVKYENKM